MRIKNVIICGLGALGLTYANKLKDVCNLKILVDENRLIKYQKNPPIFNDNILNLNYILPTDNFQADLIIISTKSFGLESAINQIKNFASKNTTIISLLNGISSENSIIRAYPDSKVIRSFFIGHSAIRNNNSVTQDGEGKIVIEKDSILEEFFNEINLNYEVSNDIKYSQWLKLGVNIILNQPSAIYEMRVGELLKLENYFSLAENLIDEVIEIAKVEGIKNLENYKKEVFDSIKLISENGITSMYQDIMAKRKTEVNIFSGEIIRLGKKYNILTPYNLEMYNKIKDKEKDF